MRYELPIYYAEEDDPVPASERGPAYVLKGATLEELRRKYNAYLEESDRGVTTLGPFVVEDDGSIRSEVSEEERDQVLGISFASSDEDDEDD